MHARVRFVLTAIVLLSAALAAPAADVDALIASLNQKDNSPKTFNELGALAATDDRAFQALVAVMRDHKDWVRRTWAAEALAISKSDRAAEAIAEMARNTRYRTDYARKQAVEALTGIGTPKAVEGLVTVLNDSRADLRALAADALGAIASAESLAALDAALPKSEAADALKKYDVRGKQTQTVDDIEITFVGVERRKSWTDSGMMAQTYRATGNNDLAIVHFRLAAKSKKEAPVLVELYDAEGKRAAPPAFQMWIYNGDPAKRPAFYQIPYVMPASAKAAKVKILGAEFDVSS